MCGPSCVRPACVHSAPVPNPLAMRARSPALPHARTHAAHPHEMQDPTIRMMLVSLIRHSCHRDSCISNVGRSNCGPDGRIARRMGEFKTRAPEASSRGSSPTKSPRPQPLLEIGVGRRAVDRIGLVDEHASATAAELSLALLEVTRSTERFVGHFEPVDRHLVAVEDK